MGSGGNYVRPSGGEEAKAAFEKECALYHDFGGPQGQLDNEVHPARPEGTDWQCPRCDVFRAAVAFGRW